MLFYSSKCERSCLLQFAILSLLPGLTSHLETAAHPHLEKIPHPDPSAKKSARAELLESFGQPLPVFCKGAFFSPYAPLQHLDMLASAQTYVVGSTNALLLQQQSRYADIMVNLDTEPYSITIFSPSLKQASMLSAADRRWIDNLTQQVLDTWDPDNPARPRNMGYAGSEEMIRLQFEEYILSLCSSMAYQVYRERTDGTIRDVLWKDDGGQETGVVSTANETDAPELQEKPQHKNENPQPKPPRPGSSAVDPSTQSQHTHHTSNLPGRSHQRSSSLDVNLPPADLAQNALDFGAEFLSLWRDTRNFELFINTLSLDTPIPTSTATSSNITNTTTPPETTRPRIFDLIPSIHPTSGNLNIDDVQRRLQQNLQDFRVAYKVDERLGQTKDNVGKAIEAGRERWGRWWTELEERRRSEKESRSSTDDPRTSIDGSAATSNAPAANTGGGAAAGSAAWAATLRERASKVQKPDTAQLQHAAKENAAKAGAYLSSWGSWAREKSRDWQQGGAAGASAKG